MKVICLRKFLLHFFSMHDYKPIQLHCHCAVGRYFTKSVMPWQWHQAVKITYFKSFAHPLRGSNGFDKLLSGNGESLRHRQAGNFPALGEE